MKHILLLLLSLVCAAPALADTPPSSVQLEHTKATLVAEHTAINHFPFSVALVLEAKEGWHTYWENPGDAGIPPDLKWTLPEGFSAGAIDWPAPQRLTEGPLATFAYPGTAFLPVTVTPGDIDEKGSYPLKLKAEWLVCKDICVPESAELQITLPATADPLMPSESAALFSEHLNQRPTKIANALSYTVADKKLILSLPLKEFKVSGITSALLFPREQNVFKYSAQTLDNSDKNAPMLTIPLEADASGQYTGILSVTDTEHHQKNFEVALGSGTAFTSPNPSAVVGDMAESKTIATAPADDESPVSFPVVILLAIMGGLVLNLMPCVLPVLSLKALSIAQKAGHKHEHVVRQGLAYTAGIMVSFGIIAGLLITLRQGGEAIGWGYQMQSPGFVGFLIYLLFMVGLSLSGLFHLPVLLGGVGNDIANESSVRGSFFTGVLATAVATPCTAPFMASAVGAALIMPPVQSMLVFEALGFGLALPFLLISIFPQLRKFLPKPGAWMDVFKQLLAFPMYASVIWLMWVLTLQTGAGGMVVALTAMLLIIIVIWMKSLFTDGSRVYTVVALAIYAAILIISLPMIASMEISTSALPGGHAKHGVETVDYSKDKLAELRKAGTPVFVDATAAWCITCQVNARVALHTDRTMAEFKKRGIVLMIADWTRRNDEITDFLGGFGYKGVPLCVFYPAKNGKPVVLPQILTEDIVFNLITAEGN